jgi:hypothetical protein
MALKFQKNYQPKNTGNTTTSKLKFVKPAPIQQPRPDIRQSQNYLNAVSNADKYAQEAKQASSFGGMLKNAIKAVPRATADVAIGTPFKFGASVAEIPKIVFKKGQTSQREYKVPGLSPFKSYQSDFQNVANDVIEGKKGLGSAALSFANPVLGGVEMLGIGKGIGKGVTAFKGASSISQGIKKATPEILDAFIPTARGFKNGTMSESSGQSQIPQSASIQSKILRTESRPNASKDVLKSSYTRKVAQKTENVNVQEAKEYKSVDKFLNEQGGDTQTIAKRADEIINPLKPKAKDRSFIETVRKSPEVSQDLANRVDDTYNVKHNEAQQIKAQKLIFDNPQEAERIAMSGGTDESTFTANELIKHYDAIATQAKKTGNQADFEVAMGKAVDIAKQNAKNLTEAGRTVQAASTINKLSPDGIIQYVNKVIKDVGGDGVRLSNEKYYEIIRKAEGIKEMLDPKQKALATFDLLDDIYADIPKSLQNKVSEALNLPRSIMATADLSAPLRQGIFTMARNPKMFAENFGKMFKYAFSEDAYRNLKADIITSPNFNLYQKHKLALTDINQGLTGREEEFMSNWAEKIPGFGKLAKGSNRAYSGFLNKMRMDLFDDFVETAKLEGITDPKFFDDASKFVGSATGRGRLPDAIEPHAGILNGIFFSPRLMASRVNLINPIYYAKLHPTVRKEALKSLAAFVGTGTAVLSLAKMNGADVSADPRSADFGKIKLGNTRYDIWGGFQQYARLIGQLTTGEKISTITGKESQLGSGGYNAPTRESIFMEFLKSKANPLTSFAIRASKGKQFGEDFNIPAEVVDRFIPMIAQDAFDLTREYGAKGLPMAIPGAFGIGSQTYGDQIPKLTTTATGNAGIEYRSQPGLGETIVNGIMGTEVSDIPKEQWGPLAEERKQEQIRQAEVDKAKTMVLASGEPQQVGDTYIYLDKGVVKTRKQGKEKRLPLKDQLLYEEIKKRESNKPYYQNKYVEEKRRTRRTIQ